MLVLLSVTTNREDNVDTVVFKASPENQVEVTNWRGSTASSGRQSSSWPLPNYMYSDRLFKCTSRKSWACSIAWIVARYSALSPAHLFAYLYQWRRILQCSVPNHHQWASLAVFQRRTHPCRSWPLEPCYSHIEKTYTAVCTELSQIPSLPPLLTAFFALGIVGTSELELHSNLVRDIHVGNIQVISHKP